ncbi:M23 family metallopeptidase [Brooklawnia cerclae]|uniref:Murein DD-endopeptidase MepM/ murein hydrolase activator NlpD n=1 Tax=Brooklawnia cerclae TaxID=349934 RepID=A0ABX0SLE0_9ACTN|nr:M23 family metallopeptidase [Brooklawnia cerclae]NIH57551.1 murein DD-endopeptidase MepM/ murein hydrolase activator NlpD [Brooklawnia cerclae]
MSLTRILSPLMALTVAAGLMIGAAPQAAAEDAVVTAQRELAQLQKEATEVQSNLNQSKEEQATAQREYDLASADLADQQVLVDQMRVQIGRVAVASHQQAAGFDAVNLFFTSDSEDSFLADMSVMQSVTAIMDEQLARLDAEQQRLTDLETTLSDSLTRIDAEITEQTNLAAEYDQKISESKKVVSRLSSSQMAELESAQNQAVLDANAQLLASALAESSERTSRDGTTTDTSGEGIWPADGPITSPFGYRTNPIGGYSELHDGTDIGAACGTPVRAAWAGVVLSARYESGWGNRVIIDSGTYKAAYNHLQVMAVAPGEFVEAGQIIAAVGTTGNSTGCHLHFSVWVNEVITDPQTLF